MIQANNVTVQFGGRALFERVNVTFSKGNCYGIIGANGAGKSTFLKVLDGELEPQKGEVVITPGERLSVLKQDHFAYDQYQVVRTVLMGNPRLIEIMEEKDALYAKPDFSEADGVRAGELEAEFADMDGWNAESDAEFMLNKLGVTDEYHYMTMAELPANLKVKVLLAQALFGNPDYFATGRVLPTTWICSAIRWLGKLPARILKTTVIVVSHDRHFLNRSAPIICDCGLWQNSNVCGQLRLLVRVHPNAPAPGSGSEQEERAEDQGITGLHCPLLCQRGQEQAGHQP
mgnify:CR=1 FL=1